LLVWVGSLVPGQKSFLYADETRIHFRVMGYRSKAFFTRRRNDATKTWVYDFNLEALRRCGVA